VASSWASVHDDAHLNSALVQQFLHVSVTEGEAVVELNGMLDDGHRETVSVRLGVGHGQSAYPNPIKATQPKILLRFRAGLKLERICLACLNLSSKTDVLFWLRV